MKNDAAVNYKTLRNSPRYKPALIPRQRELRIREELRRQLAAIVEKWNHHFFEDMWL
jgi:hypothetical protein